LTDAAGWIAARGLGAVSNDSRRLSVSALFPYPQVLPEHYLVVYWYCYRLPYIAVRDLT